MKIESDVIRIIGQIAHSTGKGTIEWDVVALKVQELIQKDRDRCELAILRLRDNSTIKEVYTSLNDLAEEVKKGELNGNS